MKASKNQAEIHQKEFNSTAARAKAPYLPLYSQTSYLLLAEGGIRLGRDETVRNGVYIMHLYLIAPLQFVVVNLSSGVTITNIKASCYLN